jgi:deoxyribose-phosphate aldolase
VKHLEQISAILKAADAFPAELPTSAPWPVPEPANLPGWIDHTLLRPDATVDQVKRLCDEASEFGFAAVCVNPVYTPLAAGLLRDAGVKICTVVGFPLGAHMAPVKIYEAETCLGAGAHELDMVLNIGALKGEAYGQVYDEIEMLVQVAHRQGAQVKVIIETALLSRFEKIVASLLSKSAGADFVKTSTGFASGGAKVEDVQLIRQVVGPEMGVKASGGVRSYESAIAMIRAGANRIGSHYSLAIIQEAKSQQRNDA